MPHVAIIANPVSGSGRTRAVAGQLDAQLQESGFETRLAWTELADAVTWLDPVLEDASTMLVVGGDGTVRMVADAAVRTRTPLWQVPCGTENLLARSLGMNSDFASIEQALRRNQSRYLDMARANGTTCLLMASAGLDAERGPRPCITAGQVDPALALPALHRPATHPVAAPAHDPAPRWEGRS